jgi:hypothetical protein
MPYIVQSGQSILSYRFTDLPTALACFERGKDTQDSLVLMQGETILKQWSR